ncbi:hypothetical protein [Actinoallomurus vinaceus]|uniref:hypothetical protein n=1 Tax=Actinoallomurus vinaceus TaxID=1080074 RepID=UPI0031E92D8E
MKLNSSGRRFGDALPTRSSPRGALTGIVGENGSAKTTLLRLPAGRERPDRGATGEFLLIAGLNGSALLRVLTGEVASDSGSVTHRNRVGHLPQEPPRVRKLLRRRPVVGYDRRLRRGRQAPTS